MSPDKFQVLGDPPKEDSPDLTDEQADAAIVTTGVQDLFTHWARLSSGPPSEHKLLRKGGNLYWRITTSGQGSDNVLVFQANWLEMEE